MAKTKKVKVVYESNAAKFNKDTKKVRDNVKGVGDDAKKTGGNLGSLSKGLNAVKGAALGAAGAFGTMGAALMASGVGAILVPLGALVGLLSSALKRSVSFEAALSNLESKSGATADEMGRLSDQAKFLGANTKFTADQVVELQTEFAKLGFTVPQIEDVTGATLNLASAAGVDLAEAAEVAGSTLRGFGLSTSETQRVVDVMAKSFTESSLNMERFKESMKLVAPIAKTVKVDIEQSSAAIALLANRGITGSIAGTQLRRIMSDLALKTGVSFRESLELTSEKLKNASSDSERLAVAKELVGDKAKGSLIALAENREELDRLTESFDNSSGAAENMATIMEDNLRGDLTKLSSAWDGFLKRIEDGTGALGKAARGIIQFFTSAINFIPRALSSMVNVIEATPAIVAMNVTKLVDQFRVLLDKVKIFAIDAKLAMSDVPLLGGLIDDKKLKQERAIVKAHMERLELAIRTKRGKIRQVAFGAIFSPFAQEEAPTAAGDTTATSSVDPEFVGGAVDGDEEGTPRITAEQKFLEKLKKMREDFEDVTQTEKLERQRDRHLSELEQLKLNEEEKEIAKEQIKKLYADKIARYEEEKAKQTRDTELAEQKRLKDEIFGHAVQVFGQESKIAKAMHFAKMAMKIKEALIDAGIMKGKAVVRSIETGQEVTKEAAKSAGNPFKLAATLAAGAAMVAQSIRAKSKIESSVNQFAGAIGGSPSTGNVAPPSFNVIGAASAGENLIAESIESKNSEPVKAYVVESEISDKQKAINEARKLRTL